MDAETNGSTRRTLRALVRGAYTLQKLRVQMGNRVVAALKQRLGIEPSEPEDEADPKAQECLAEMRLAHKRLADAVPEALRAKAPFPSDPLIHTYAEWVLVATYISIEKREHDLFTKELPIMLDYIPIWKWLKGVKGVGPALAAVMIAEFDITKAKYPSSLWKYAGLDVAQDGAGRSRRKEHLIKRPYVDAKGKEQERDSVTFNPFLKTKLMGVLAPSILRAGATNNPYRAIYDGYKHRLESHAVYGTHNDKAEKSDDPRKRTSKGRRHNMAMRYMVKQFLIDLHREWRTVEGLPVSVPYHEAKLGMTHGENTSLALPA